LLIASLCFRIRAFSPTASSRNPGSLRQSPPFITCAMRSLLPSTRAASDAGRVLSSSRTAPSRSRAWSALSSGRVTSQHQAAGYYAMRCEALIYYGVPIQAFDDVPDAEGRVRLEKLYAALFDMDAAIRAAVVAQRGSPLETVLDEDRLDTYKLMALRCVVVA